MRLRLAAFLFLALTASAAITARAEVMIVLNSGDHTYSIFDRKTLKEIRRVPTGKEPHHLMPTPDDKSLVIGKAASNELMFVDPLTGDIQKRIKDIADPYQLGFSPDQKWFVTAALRLNHVDIYTADYKLSKRIPIGKAPSHIIFNADSSMVFVTLQDSGEIAAIDLKTQTIAWRLPVGDLPAGIWMTPDDKHLLIGVMGSDHVAVVDWRTKQLVKRIPTGKGAHNFQALGDGKHVFVTNRVEASVSLIDQSTLTAVRKYKTLAGPDCMEVTADGKQLWLTARWAQRVIAIDIESGKMVANLPTGRSPHGIYFKSHAARK